MVYVPSDVSLPLTIDGTFTSPANCPAIALAIGSTVMPAAGCDSVTPGDVRAWTPLPADPSHRHDFDAGGV